MRPLMEVASGGELSRIMLAIKTVLADSDDIPTLIFDEIDTGISGRTAQKVSEKLSYIAKSHQVICITHLPQIAAAADAHYLIQKQTDQTTTKTGIFPLDEDASVGELARLLGGAQVTKNILDSAKEMKEMAAVYGFDISRPANKRKRSCAVAVLRISCSNQDSERSCNECWTYLYIP